MNNNNPLEIVKNYMNNGGSLPAVIEKAVGKSLINNSNPMFINAFDMAKQGNKQGLEDFARNLLKQQGRDFDTEFENFKKNFSN